jgi:hypothetical protein
VKLGAACLGRPVSQTTLGPLGQPEKAIGHEPQIEPWLAPDHRCACWSQSGLASSQLYDENRWERKSKQPHQAVHRTESMGRKIRTILAHSHGLESKKDPATAEVFFLTFPFIELHRTWPLPLCVSRAKAVSEALATNLPNFYFVEAEAL